MNKMHVDVVYNPFIEIAATDPLLCSLSLENDQIQAVVKMFNNRQGNLSLINEYIASRLCNLFGISLPQSGICYIDDKTKLSEYYEKHSIITSRNFGPAFYSKYIDRTIEFIPKMITHVDKSQIANMIVFDHLIYNADRHRGNVLIEVGKTIKFYLIDHTHIFKNECIWDHYTFERGISEKDYQDEEIFDSNHSVYENAILYAGLKRTDIEKTSKTIQEKLTPQILQSIIKDIPPEWSKGLDEDISALQTYVLYRAEHLPEMVELIVRKGGL